MAGGGGGGKKRGRKVGEEVVNPPRRIAGVGRLNYDFFHHHPLLNVLQ